MQIEVEFHMVHALDETSLIYPWHMTKMCSMSIKGKTIKIFSRIWGQSPLVLVCNIIDIDLIKFVRIMILWRY